MIQHCRKNIHSRTKENRLVIQLQKALWRKLEPLFNRNKKLYAWKEVKETALASEGKSGRPETKTTVNRSVCHDLSVWNKRLKSHLLSENVKPSRAWSTQQRKIAYDNKHHFGMKWKSCWPITPFYCGSSTSKLSSDISFDRRFDGWYENGESSTHRFTEYSELRLGVMSTDCFESSEKTGPSCLRL